MCYSNTLIFSNLDPGTPPLGIVVRGGGLSSEFFNFSKNQHLLPVALHNHLMESAFGYECYLLRASEVVDDVNQTYIILVKSALNVSGIGYG